MSNIYRTNFDGVKEVYKGIFDALERALIKFDIDYYFNRSPIKGCLDQPFAFGKKNNEGH